MARCHCYCSGSWRLSCRNVRLRSLRRPRPAIRRRTVSAHYRTGCPAYWRTAWFLGAGRTACFPGAGRTASTSAEWTHGAWRSGWRSTAADAGLSSESDHAMRRLSSSSDSSTGSSIVASGGS